jgi:Flp pilus assembly protein TadG
MRGLGEFAKSRDGNFAIVFAVGLTGLLMAAGVGLDVANSISARRQMQNALDSAVLAAASKGGALDQAYAKTFFESNALNGWIDLNSLAFSTDEDGNIVGSAHAKMKTTLMAIAGVTDIDIAVSSKATSTSETKIENATFNIKNAKGAFDKDIYFYTRDANGKIVSETLILQYDYVNPNQYYKPAKTSSITVNVGHYASYGYKMVVYEDTSYNGKHIKPKTHYSDDADASTWTKVSGECSDSKGSTNYWEDQGDNDFLDFIFTVKCTETVSGTKDIRLLE